MLLGWAGLELGAAFARKGCRAGTTPPCPWAPSLPLVQPQSVPSCGTLRAAIVSFPACGLLGKGEEI